MELNQYNCWFNITGSNKLEHFLKTQTVFNLTHISVMIQYIQYRKMRSEIHLKCWSHFHFLPECGTGYAYLPISLIGAHYTAENPKHCLELCNSSEDCNFWHYDGFESCSLFISGEKRTRFVGGRYSYGPKHCTFTGILIRGIRGSDYYQVAPIMTLNILTSVTF